MKPLLLVLSLLVYRLHAQSEVCGLGTYRIGSTTPDSLKGTGFNEEQSLVKGTIALECMHVRTFKAARIDILGVLVADLYLYFYDNILFKISCTYNDALTTAFVSKHGEGVSIPGIRVQYCTKSKDKSMLIEREIWQTGDFFAVIIHAKGHNASCEAEEAKRLIISNQRVLALASDCELPNPYPFMDEFGNGVNGR